MITNYNIFSFNKKVKKTLIFAVFIYLFIYFLAPFGSIECSAEQNKHDSLSSYIGILSQDLNSDDYIRILGSSTIYPFITVVAERFASTSSFSAPIVESTGSGGGLKLLCSKAKVKMPDMATSSRKIRASEIALCKKNNIELQEIILGYDGIILVNANDAPSYSLTMQELFLALAQQIPTGGGWVNNNYHEWYDIAQHLPHREIEIYGPPISSGTRDALVSLIMEPICNNHHSCGIIRNDQHFIELGRSENLILRKLGSNHNAIGIVGFNFFEQNRHVVKPVLINGVEPNVQTIANGKYLLSRPLYIYLNKNHLGKVKGLAEFVTELTAPHTVGPNGYLIKRGLVSRRVVWAG